MSNEPNWPAGPWRLRDDGPPFNDVVAGDRVLATVYPKTSSGSGNVLRSYDEAQAVATLFAASRDLYEAAALLEAAEDAHANCPDCLGEEIPERCPTCFPLFDDARLKRRAALAKGRGEKP